MESGKTKENLNQDRRFFAVTVPLVTLLMAGLISMLVWWTNGGSVRYYRARFEELLSGGAYEEAQAMTEKLEDDTASARVTYLKAGALFEAGNFDEAEVLYASLGTYEQAKDYVKACRYEKAAAAMAAGEYDLAAKAFLDLSGYRDSLARYDVCRYKKAGLLLDAGEQQEAFRLYLALGEYEDAAAQAKKIACAITGETDGEKALLLAQGYSAEVWEHIGTLQQKRQSVSAGSIAAGWKHVLVLEEGGTVAAYGDNSHGQCDTASFQNVKQIAAGAYFTLALTEDGRVLSCGDNQYGQCDTDSWGDCKLIAAGDYDAFALTKDGRVLHCGYTQMDEVFEWTDIMDIAAGNCVAAALRQDGTVLCTMASGRMETQSTAYSIKANLGWSAVLKQDGTVVSDTVSTEEWKDVLRLYSSSTVLCGVREDGSVVALALMRGGEKLRASLAGLKDTVELAPASSWSAVRYADGSVALVGELPDSLRDVTLR